MADTKLTVALVLNSASFAKQLKDVSNKLKLNESEFEKAMKASQGYADSLEGQAKKITHLTKAQDLITQKMGLYSKEISQSEDKLDEYARAHEEGAKKVKQLEQEMMGLNVKLNQSAETYEKYEKNLMEAVAEQAKLEKNMISTSQRIDTLNTSLNKAESEYIDLGQAIQEADQRMENFDVEQQAKAFEQATEQMDNMGDKFTAVGDILTGVGETMDKYIATPLIEMGDYSIKASTDFEYGMSKVQALSSATGDDMAKLEDKALELGKVLPQSASQSAEAFQYMALAGWDTNDMLAGIEPMMKASTASGKDLGLICDLVTDTLGAFGKEADYTATYLDIVAQTSRKTNTDMDSLMQAFIRVGSSANNLGLDVETTSTALGILASNGMKGSTAGTKLNRILTKLTAQTKPTKDALKTLGVEVFDNQGKFRGLETVLGEVGKSMNGMSNEQQQMLLKMLVGTDNINAFSILMKSTGKDVEGTGKSFKDTEKEIRNFDGAVNEMSDTMGNTTQGRIQALKSNIESLALKFGKALLPILEKVTTALGKVVDWFGGLSEPMKKAIVYGGLFAIATTKVTKGLGGMISGAGNAIFGVSALARAFGATGRIGAMATRVMGGFGGVATTVATTTGGAGASVGLLSSAMGLLAPALPWIAGGLAVTGVAIGGLAVGAKALAGDFNDDVVPAVDLFADKVETTSQVVNTANGAMTVSAQETTLKISDATKQAVGAYMDLDKNVSASLFNMGMNQNVLTEQMKTDTINKFKELTNGVKFENNDMKQSYLNGFNDLMIGSTHLTQQTKDQVVAKVQEMVNLNKNLSNEQKEKIVGDFMATFSATTGITQAQVDTVGGQYEALRNNVNTSLSNNYNSQKQLLLDHFATSNALTEEQEKTMLASLTDNYNQETSVATAHYERAVQIIKGAKDQKRDMTNEEYAELSEIQNKMREHAVTKLSEQEEESALILGRMKGNQNRLTAEMVSENIIKLNEQRDKTIQMAQDECTKKIAQYQKLKSTLPPEQHAMVDELISEAERSRDMQVKSAEDLRAKAVDEMKKMGGEMVSQVNTDTGAMKIELNGFQSWWNGLSFVPKFLKFKEERTVETKQVNVPATQATQALPMLTSAYSTVSNGLRNVSIPNANTRGYDYQSLAMSATNGGRSSSTTNSSDNGSVLAELRAQNELLKAMVNQLSSDKQVDVGINIDGRAIAKATAIYMDNEIDTIKKRKSRLGGNL